MLGKKNSEFVWMKSAFYNHIRNALFLLENMEYLKMEVSMCALLMGENKDEEECRRRKC